MLRQRRDVLGLVAQRGHRDGDHVDPIVEVLAELPLLDQLLEILVRRRDHADVHGDLFRAADPPDLPLLEHAQQLDLHRRRGFSDLVEEDRTAARHLEQTLLVAGRPGEGPLHVPEQLTLEQLVGQRSTVDRNERAFAVARVVVDRPRNQLLARAGLARDHHRAAGGGHAPDQLEDRRHLVAAADQSFELEVALQLGPEVAVFQLEVLVFRDQPLLFQRLADHALHLVQIEGLLDVVGGPGVERLDRGLLGPERGHQDDLGLARQAPRVAQQLETRHAGHGNIGDHEIECAALVHPLDGSFR